MSSLRKIWVGARQIRRYASTEVPAVTTTTAAATENSTASDTAQLVRDIQESSRGSAAAVRQPTEFKSDTIVPQDYYLHCLTSHSNTLLTLTNHKHEPIMWTSAGLCGFKKAARGGYEAGFRSMLTMLGKMKQKEDEDAALAIKSRVDPRHVQKTQAKKQKPPFRPRRIQLIIKDFGLGREAIATVLTSQEGDHYRTKITSIVDATPLKFGGVRARAKRRL